MKVLVLGGTGMLGHKIVQHLLKHPGRVWWTLRTQASDAALDPVPELRGDSAFENVDASRFSQISDILIDLKPDVVVNCVGVIKQRPEAIDPVPCITINALLPHRLARALASYGGRLIHISTDCVFRGDRGAYTERDTPDATDLYGITKALGEVRYDNALTLRTSVIGRELRYHQSLLDWFLAQRGGRIQGYRQVMWSGLTSLEVARLIEYVILHQPSLSGVFNVAGDPVSKYALLEMLRDAYALDVEIEPIDSIRRDLTLDASRFSSLTSYRAPEWPAMLDDLVADPTAYAPLGISVENPVISSAL